MSARCADYDFLYTRWTMSCTLSETDAAEAKAALMAHAAECKICAQAVRNAFERSKPLPISDREEAEQIERSEWMRKNAQVEMTADMLKIPEASKPLPEVENV